MISRVLNNILTCNNFVNRLCVTKSVTRWYSGAQIVFTKAFIEDYDKVWSKVSHHRSNRDYEAYSNIVWPCSGPWFQPFTKHELCLIEFYFSDFTWASRVSKYWQLKWVFNSLFRMITKETWKLRITVFCEGIPPVTDGFTLWRTSSAVVVSIYYDVSMQNPSFPWDYMLKIQPGPA